MVNLALLGAGRIGQVHARTISVVDGVRLKYVFDPVETATITVVERHGAKLAGLDEILADPDIRGVLICTPSDQHAEQIQKAVIAGKAVFCEKPISTDVQTTERTLDIVERHHGLLMLGFQRRFDKHFAALKAKLSENIFGPLEQLLIISRDPSPPPYEYMRVSGGLFKDMTIHDFDMARWLVGEKISTVYATGSALVDDQTRTQGRDIDTATVLLSTETGKQITIINSRRAAVGYDQRVEAHCANATLQVNSVRETNLVVSDSSGIGESPLENFFMTRYQDAYRREMEHFIECLKVRGSPLVTGSDGLEALRLAEAALASLGTQRPVSLLDA
jgi:myo-inositol 2-dehydrogenase/D-chiro-inositol 1-dehydrogenase